MHVLYVAVGVFFVGRRLRRGLAAREVSGRGGSAWGSAGWWRRSPAWLRRGGAAVNSGELRWTRELRDADVVHEKRQNFVHKMRNDEGNRFPEFGVSRRLTGDVIDAEAELDRRTSASKFASYGAALGKIFGGFGRVGGGARRGDLYRGRGCPDACSRRRNPASAETPARSLMED